MVRVASIAFFTVWVISALAFAETISQPTEGQRVSTEAIPQASHATTEQEDQRWPSKGKAIGYTCLGGGAGALIGGALGFIIGASIPVDKSTLSGFFNAIGHALLGLEIGAVVGGGAGVGISIALLKANTKDANEKSASVDRQKYGMIVRYSWRF